MSTSERRSRENGCELKPYTNWPLILGAATILVAGGVAVGLMPRKSAEAPAKVRYRPNVETRVGRVVVPEEVVPEPVLLEDESPRGPVVIEHIEMLGMPRVETAMSLATERMTFDRLAADAFELRSGRLKLAVMSEEQMLRLLVEKSKEIDIGKDALAALNKAGTAKDKEGHAEASHRAISEIVQKRTDLAGLPLVAMEDCVLSKEESKALAGVSLMKSRSRGDSRSSEARERHGSTATFRGEPTTFLASGDRDGRLAEYRGGSTPSFEEIPSEFVRPLRQVYEVQPEKSRVALAQVLAKSKSRLAAQALARLAVFDLSERVRDEAVQQLVGQDRATVRAELLAAFRHPWAPAAVHAAKAIDRLGDKGMIPALKKLLDQPDPCAPFQEKDTWYVRELVRVNHLKNCLMCHPPADTKRPTLSGPIPLRDRALPVAYYASRDKTSPLVDASTVDLRQDFSVLHELKDAKPWPEVQRFDYLVRTRPLRAEEIPKKKGAKAIPSAFIYPQREVIQELLAVLVCKEPARMEP